MMETIFAAAVASTLVPGGRLANHVMVPCAGRLLDEAHLSDWLAGNECAAAVAAILEVTGGARAFIEASPERRTTALQVAEAEQRPSFDRLVATLLQLYYEHPTVLESFGWRTAPPQPDGHELPSIDNDRFEPVTKRGQIWRKVV